MHIVFISSPKSFMEFLLCTLFFILLPKIVGGFNALISLNVKFINVAFDCRSLSRK